jgi:hypothetical protein
LANAKLSEGTLVVEDGKRHKRRVVGITPSLDQKTEQPIINKVIYRRIVQMAKETGITTSWFMQNLYPTHGITTCLGVVCKKRPVIAVLRQFRVT